MAEHSYLVVEAFSETASFRIPEYHNYHKTLPLPPPTAVIGMVGASLGLSPEKAQSLFDVVKPELGVYGTYNGIFKDLWKIASTKKGTESSIVQREYLYNNDYILVVGADNETIQKLYKAVSYNKYPITAGNSDSLVKILYCNIVGSDCIVSTNEVEHCVLFGDYRQCLKFGLESMEPNKVYVYKKRFAPQTYNIPVAFDYDSEGCRTIRMRKEVTFVCTRQELNGVAPLKALQYGEKRIPLFTYYG